jgi:hypothetical protein
MKTRLTQEQKEANKLARKQAKEHAKEIDRINSEKNQPEISEITFTIEWRKSRMYGNNPHLTARVHFKDGKYVSKNYTCSGYGYDKESTVIAQAFNDFLKYKLWKLTPEQLKGGNGSLDKGSAPYGIHIYSENRPHFGGGIGVGCYYEIAKYIGGKFEHTAWGSTFDVYKYTDL